MHIKVLLATVNNGGTVVKAGNVASDSAVTKVIGVNELNTGDDYGSKGSH